MPVGEHENDTAVLMRALSQCNSGAEITQLLAGVQGPFAFVFWQVCSGDHIPAFLLVTFACYTSAVPCARTVGLKGVYGGGVDTRAAAVLRAGPSVSAQLAAVSPVGGHAAPGVRLHRAREHGSVVSAVFVLVGTVARLAPCPATDRGRDQHHQSGGGRRDPRGDARDLGPPGRFDGGGGSACAATAASGGRGAVQQCGRVLGRGGAPGYLLAADCGIGMSHLPV